MTDGPRESRPRRTLRETWFWVSQIGSIIGLISIIDDLKLWIEAVSWLVTRLRDVLSPLADLVVLLAWAIDGVLEVFRGLFRPILEFLLQSLPFDIPNVIKDMIVVIMFIALGLVRTRRRYLEELRATRAHQNERERLHLSFRKAGIDVHWSDVWEVAEAILYYHALRERPARFFKQRRARAAVRWEEAWQAALRYYGPPLQAHADATLGKLLGPDTSKLISRHKAARSIVWRLGLVTAILVAFDLWLMH